MSWAWIVACLWVLAAAATAMLPMKRQYAPGLTLLLIAPVLIVWLGATYGWWVSALAGLAFISMFRHPLRYLIGRAMGEKPEVPR